MEWNFDIEAAPKGTWEEETRHVGKNTVVIPKHVPVVIIAAGNEGVVTLSHWMPKEERWNRFSKGTPPLAWMPWPEHPHATK